MDHISRVYESVLEGDEHTVSKLCRDAIDSGADLYKIIERGLIPAMDHLSDELAREEKFIPEILLSAKAMQTGIRMIESHVARRDILPIGAKVVVGTVMGDIHSIGKDLVSIMLRSGGFSVIDLGTNVRPEVFRNAIEESGASIVTMSAMLTISMNSMRDTVLELRRMQGGESLNIIIGGAPITRRFAERYGVIYAGSALDTLKEAKKIFQSNIISPNP